MKTWKVKSKGETQEDAEDGADAERGEHGGARRQAVARQWPWSKTVPSRRMQGTGGRAEDDAGVETRVRGSGGKGCAAKRVKVLRASARRGSIGLHGK